ncbi:probable lipoxygenase 6 [Phalaenopsis equestris]|uniref:probable lipoxygenase 6 n=1 Tax=Phalaenopsis equestris TaxID=78828 RepID=UPI0009E405BC|nr:probable lipoxygenase 6 [Phalaenopsis equestris]
MAIAGQVAGPYLVRRSSMLPDPNILMLGMKQSSGLCSSTPILFPAKQGGFLSRSLRLMRSPVATLREEVVSLVVGKPAKIKVRAVITVRKKSKEDLLDAVAKQLDPKIGKNVVLELISTQINKRTRAPKKSGEAVIKDWDDKMKAKGERAVCVVDFTVDSDFGEPGAITVANRHQREFFLESIIVEGFPFGTVHFLCNSWVQLMKDIPSKRVFFSNKAYLSWETPEGLKELREKELIELRGDGNGVRKLSDRIYDYATYNDLGNPDKGKEHSRPNLGGEKMPYPRRCRTGRAPTDTNLECESRIEKPHPVYVPRDEAFEELKQDTFSAGRLKAVLHNLVPSLVASVSAENLDFQCFHDIDNLYKDGLLLKLGIEGHLLHKIPLVRKLHQSSHGFLRYDTPSILSKDKFAWLRDDELGRQAIAGINPVNIERVQVFPPVSKLDPDLYGPPESAITETHIAGHLNGMSVQQAIEEEKLFMIDHHDTYLPFVDRINSLDGRKSYATRVIFFLSSLGTLRPVAIELALPPETAGGKRFSRVLTPPCDATTSWLWQLGKAHACANDCGVHQLVNHWLRTHACMEPFILAAHRRLSCMHPVFRLLHPHMRYTLEINALARQSLVNAGGVIESCFTPGPLCMEISADYYRQHWRFDKEGLPADLIRRGVAVEDPSQPHSLRLLISDYPYAEDGLLIWSAIECWVNHYTNHYYPNTSSILSDTELQSWYSESINSGHADLRHSTWWPSLSTPTHLSSILTTLIWISSAQHAALNFGQYPLGGYVPNRPPLMRRLLPDDKDAAFVADPHRYFLSAMPSVLQTTKFMAVVDTLSTHSPDEEYLGQRREAAWTAEEEVLEGYEEFSAEMGRIEEEIGRRNWDSEKRNRCGAGVLGYELLVPSSGPGVTARGVPNSISI